MRYLTPLILLGSAAAAVFGVLAHRVRRPRRIALGSVTPAHRARLDSDDAARLRD